LSASENPWYRPQKDYILKGCERSSFVLIIDDLASLQDAAQSQIAHQGFRHCSTPGYLLTPHRGDGIELSAEGAKDNSQGWSEAEPLGTIANSASSPERVQ